MISNGYTQTWRHVQVQVDHEGNEGDLQSSCSNNAHGCQNHCIWCRQLSYQHVFTHSLSLYLDGTRHIALHSQLTNTKNIEVESFVDTFGD